LPATLLCAAGDECQRQHLLSLSCADSITAHSTKTRLTRRRQSYISRGLGDNWQANYEITSVLLVVQRWMGMDYVVITDRRAHTSRTTMVLTRCLVGQPAMIHTHMSQT